MLGLQIQSECNRKWESADAPEPTMVRHCRRMLGTEGLCCLRIHRLRPSFPMWWCLEMRPLVSNVVWVRFRVEPAWWDWWPNKELKRLELSVVWGLREKTAIHTPGRRLSPDTRSAGISILDVPASRGVAKKCSLCKPLIWWCFCYSSPAKTGA